MPSPAKKKRRRATAYSLDTSVVRLTHEVKRRIISEAKWGESIDSALRRKYGMKPWNGKQEKPTRGRREA